MQPSDSSSSLHHPFDTAEEAATTRWGEGREASRGAFRRNSASFAKLSVSAQNRSGQKSVDLKKREKPCTCSVHHATSQISMAAGPAAPPLRAPRQRISIGRRLRWITRKLNLLFNLSGGTTAERRRRDLRRNDSKVNYRRVIGSAVWRWRWPPRLVGGQTRWHR